MTISSNQSVLHGYDEMTISISSMSGFTNGETIYVKGAFYKDGSANYFGFTQNNSDWIKNGDSIVNQRQVQIGNWDEQLVIKSDFDDSGYQGEGDYKVKVGFYYITAGGNVSPVSWSANSLDITINDPDPTPTPTALPTNTPIPTVRPSATLTPRPTLTPTKSPTIALATSSATPISTSGVLGSSVSSQPSLVAGIQENKFNWLGFLFTFFGIVLLVACAILFSWKKFHFPWEKKETHEDSNE